jgi:hypothetical protein
MLGKGEGCKFLNKNPEMLGSKQAGFGGGRFGGRSPWEFFVASLVVREAVWHNPRQLLLSHLFLLPRPVPA